MKSLLIFILLSLLVSCATKPQKIAPTKAPLKAHQLYKKAKKKEKRKKYVMAIKYLNQLIKKYPASEITDDAIILKGHIFFKQKKYEKAYKEYISVVNSDIHSPEETNALYYSAKSLSNIFRFNEALGVTDQILSAEHVELSTLANTHKLRYHLFSQLGDPLDALRSLYELTQINLKTDFKKKYTLKAMEHIQSKLDQNQLVLVANSSEFGILRAYALYKVGLYYFDLKEYSQATDAFTDSINIAPDASFTENAKERLEQLLARNKVNATTIGVILPLTGRYKSVAQKILKGLQLGLGIYGNTRSNFTLSVMDSGQNPDVARRAVTELVAKDHVIAIVGSLLSKTSTAVASKADELGVPNISFSQKPGLTNIGEHVFRNAVTAEMQIRHLVNEAIHIRKLKKFAILYPNDPYGVEYANLFWDEVLAQGGEIVGAQKYPPKETNFSGPLSRLVGTFYYEDRLSEYQFLLKDWYGKQKYLNSRVTPPDDLLPPVIDFQALFIPDNTKALGQISPTLAYHDIDDIHLMGTNLWNNKTFIQRSGKFVDQSFFMDVLLSKDKDFKKTEFYKLYKDTYNDTPSLFEAQAYDIGLILQQLIVSGSQNRIDLSKSLNNIYQFNGSFGQLKVNNMREIIRPLYTLEVKEGKIQKILGAHSPNKPQKSKLSK
ncbi:MAG: ABC transporter substrate-binding protein [Bdellovibrionaceae bacterium]|nr:ABC transporter substrate-binding protein [Pseudobdellovibrionaceae bacterium]